MLKHVPAQVIVMISLYLTNAGIQTAGLDITRSGDSKYAGQMAGSEVVGFCGSAGIALAAALAAGFETTDRGLF